MSSKKTTLLTIGPSLAVLLLLFVPQIINISYFESLEPDFSNLAIEAVSSNNTTQLGFEILELEQSKWAVANVSSPPWEHELSILSKSPRIGRLLQNNTTTINISHMSGLEPDFSNLLIQFISGQNTTNISYEITEYSSSEWALIELESRPLEHETVEILALNLGAPPILQEEEAPAFEILEEHDGISLVLTSKGKSIQIQNQLLSELEQGKTVRVIAKSNEKVDAQGFALIFSIPSKNLQVFEIDKSSINGLAGLGFESIYIDYKMQASLSDTIPLIGAGMVQNELNNTGNGTAICLLDTGVDILLPSLGGKAVSGYDFVNNGTSASDDNGHGTFMASVIHAVAPDALILSVKVLDENATGYASGIIAGIEYCSEFSGAGVMDIISMSFGGGNYTGYCNSDPVAQAANDAVEAGLFAVASTGNDGANYITAPACGQSVTAVSSTSKQDTVSSFSNTNSLVDLLAPGQSVTAQGMSGQETKSGTSISAAHVSGAASLLIANNSSLSPEQTKDRLQTTGKLIEFSSANYTRINVYNAIINNITGSPTNQTGNQTNQTGNQTYGAQFDIGNCDEGELDSSDETYYLTDNVVGVMSGQEYCLHISASDVTLDCSGYSINDDGAEGTYGILVDPDVTGISIINSGSGGCTILGYTNGLYLSSGSQGTYTDITSYGEGGGGGEGQNYGIYIDNSDSNTITGATVYGNEVHGIYIDSSSNNEISSSSVYSNTEHGIFMDPSYNNSIIANSIYSNSKDGIHLDDSHNNTIVNNSIYSNTGNGIYLGASTRNNLTNNSIYANSFYGIHVNAGSNYTNMTDNMVNSSTNTSIYVQSGTNAFIDCRGKQMAGGSGAATYGVKVDDECATVQLCRISNFSKGIYFYGDSADNGIINDNNVTIPNGSGICVYQGDYNSLNRNIVVASVNAILIYYNGDHNNVTGGIANSTGTGSGFYIQNGNYNQAFDLQISSEGYAGIYITHSATTSNYNNITNVSISASGATTCGIYLYKATHTRITNSSSYSKSYIATWLRQGNSNSISGHTSASDGSYSCYVYDSDDNQFTDSTCNSTANAGLIAHVGSNRNNFTNMNISSTASISVYSLNELNSRYVNVHSTSYNNQGWYFVSPSENITIINSSGTSQTGSGSGFYNNGRPNFNITNFIGTSAGAEGVYVRGNPTGIIFNNVSGTSSTGTGVRLESNRGVFENGTATITSGTAAMLVESSNNTIANYTFTVNGGGTEPLLLITPKSGSASNNTFYWNNFTDATGLYVNDTSGPNYYNSTEGNIWHNVIDGSVQIIGTTASSYGSGLYIGTAGSGYPYSNSTSQSKVVGIVTDYAPLTNLSTLCQNLTTANSTYTLTANATINGATCFNISAGNVTLNCNGYSIIGNNTTSTYGVYSNQQYSQVLNCNILNFSTGIYFNGATSSNALNNTINGSCSYAGGTPYSVAIYATGSGYLIANNTGHSVFSGGFMSQALSTSVIENNTFYGGSYALNLVNTATHTIVRNNQVFTTGITVAADIRGIRIGTSTNLTITNNSVVSHGHGIYFDQASPNIVIDCQGATLTGTNITDTYGIYTDQQNTTVKNCIISNFSEAIRYSSATDGQMLNNSITTTFFGGKGIRLISNAHRNNLTQNTITNGNASGIYIDGGQNATVDCQGMNVAGENFSATYGLYTTQINTTVKNCNISNFASGIYYSGADNGTIEDTNVSTTYSSGSFPNGFAVSLYSGSDYNIVRRVSGSCISYYCLLVYSSSTFNTVRDSAFSTTGGVTAVSAYSASDNTFINVTGTGGSASGMYIYTAPRTNVINSTGTSTSNNGVYISASDYITLTNVTGNSSSNYGIYLLTSDYNNITNSTAKNSQYGIYISASVNNTLTNNNVTGNSVTGVYIDSGSNDSTLTSNSMCSNELDISNSQSSNTGTLNSCDSFSGWWFENGHAGCTFACTSLWHKFFGNFTGGNFTLSHTNTTPYVYLWNATGGLNVYVTDYDATVTWESLQAIGKTTANASSSADFEELDTAFVATAFDDNINATYSTNGSAANQTQNYTVFSKGIDYVPVAPSHPFNTSFKTGILWDTSDGGTEYSNSFNQTTVWIVQMDEAAAPEVFGTYDYLIQIPYTLSTYEEGNDLVSIYLELQ